MAEAARTHLKTRNIKWLVSLAVLDAALIVGLALPQAQGTAGTKELAGKILAPGMLPLIVLILINVIPTSAKFALLYWRGKDGLPGASAFSRHGPADPRVDMEMVTRGLAVPPISAAEQNKAWYRLYRQVQSEPAVEQAHQLSLMFRDMAAMSVVLAIAVPPVALWTTGDPRAAGVAFGILAVQYLVLVATGRNAGVRFVCNVMAEHSVPRD